MRLKSSKAFTLLELLITASILAGAVVFVLRSFTAALSAQRFSQNIVLACLFVDNKLQEIEQKQKEPDYPLRPESGAEKISERDLNWNYQTQALGDSGLIELKLTVSWREKIKEKPYSMEFLTYLAPKE